MRGSTIRWSGPETPWPRTRRGGSRLAQSSRRRSALRARRASAVHHRSLGTNVTPRISLFASDSAVTFPPRRARTTAVARCFRRTPAYRRAEAGAADRACPTGGAGASLPCQVPRARLSWTRPRLRPSSCTLAVRWVPWRHVAQPGPPQRSTGPNSLSEGGTE
jgi:hypothetical protein